MAEVLAIARSRQSSSVTDIYVSVGPLSGVERPLMRSAFPFAAASTVASHAELHLQQTPVCVSCDECGAETEVAANRLVCGHCGNWRTQLVSGDELVLQRVLMKTDGQGSECNV